jgi:hypothetical protein
MSITDLLLAVQVAAIIAAICALALWSMRMYRTPADNRREMLKEIQDRLREIHYLLIEGETTMFERQMLFTEMYGLIVQRRLVLNDEIVGTDVIDA